MKAAATPTSKSIRSLALVAAIAVAAMVSFGSAQHVSADGNNTITFTEPVNANHISFVTPANAGQTALNPPNSTPTGITLTSPVAITSTNADAGSTASAGAAVPGN